MKYKSITKYKARFISSFMAATIAICTLPFFIKPIKSEAAVISSNALVSEANTRSAGYTSEKAFRDAIIAACKKLDGVKYTWGGGGWNGIDCAGSVSVAYSVALGTMTINSTPGSYGSKTLSYSGGGTPDKYGFEIPGYAGIKSSFTNGLLKIRGITPSENHFSSFDTNGTSGIQNSEWIDIINTYGIRPGDMLMWWNDNNDSTNAQHITIFAGIEDGVAYQWTGSSSMGYFCKRPLADSTSEYGKGRFTGFMALRATALVEEAYVGFSLDKRDPSGFNYTGAIFSFYKDESLTDKVGELRDDDGDGVYTDYYALKDGTYTNQKFKMSHVDDTYSPYSDKLYVKETKAPSGIILPDGTSRSLADQSGNIPGIYNFIDDSTYILRCSVSYPDGSKGRLAYSLYRVGEDLMIATSIDGYNYIDGSNAVVLTNMVTDSSTLGRGKGAGLFTEASSISLEKVTSTDIDVTTTVFTVSEGSDVVATYKYADDAWAWYDAFGIKWDGCDSFPLKYGTSYVVTETFEDPEPFKCIDGTSIDYEVTNDTDGWTKVDDHTYQYGFTTDSLKTKCTYDLSVENNKVSGRIKVVKSVSDEDDTKDGFVFELWNEDKTKMLAKGTSASDGIVYWETGSGKRLAFFEVPSGNYVLIENKPVKYYDGTSNAYSYKVPEGFKTGEDGRWYKEITVTSELHEESVVNDRSEGFIKVVKYAEDGYVYNVGFELYYGGNQAEPSWQTASFVKGTTDKNGVLEFNNLPTGWYRIDETAEPVYSVIWDDGSKGRSRIVHLTEADDNKVVSTSAKNMLDFDSDIRTELTDGNSSHDISCGNEVEIVDTVYCENLIAGYEYKLKGSLVDKNTGKVLQDKDGNDYTTIVVFTADSSIGDVTKDSKGRDVVSGYIEVPFIVDTAYLFEQVLAKGKDLFSLVCFEELSFRSVLIAEHKDIDDDDQTVYVSPAIRTSASDSLTNTSVMALSETIGINDKVSFEGLAPNEKYMLKATLMNKSTGEPYMDSDGNTYEKEAIFTPDKPYGYVIVDFTDVKVPLENIDLVVFEKLYVYKSGLPIAVHEDINDEDQTVSRPSCSTYATTSAGNKAFLENTVVTVVDHVYYEGLEVGNTYYAKASLLLSDGTSVISKGTEVVSLQEFVPETESGVVDVTIKFNSSNLRSGDRVVVMEAIYDKSTEEEVSLGLQSDDVKVLSHEDINDMEQSLSVTSIPNSGELLSNEMVTGVAVALMSIGAAAAAAVYEIKRKRIKRN